MALVALPPELKLDIADLLDPDSTLHFALTCKAHAKLVKFTLIEHLLLLSEETVINTTDDLTLPWKILRAVIMDPRQGWYIRELQLPLGRQESLNYDMNLSEEDKALFVEAAKKLRNLYPEPEADNLQSRIYHATNTPPHRASTISSIEDGINANSQGAILALLLHYLPCLTSIKHSWCLGEDCLELMLWEIARGYKNPVVAPKLPLQHLKEVSMTCTFREGSISANWAYYYLSVPSLKTFAVRQMRGSASQEVQQSLFPDGSTPCSNVVELAFMKSLFDVDALANILAMAKHLEKLTYEGGPALVSSTWYEPKRVLEAVVTYAAPSLEELSLMQDDDEANVRCYFPWKFYAKFICQIAPDLPGPDIVSLRGCRKLRMLICTWSILRSKTKEETNLQHDEEQHGEIHAAFDVRTILPESIEELYLYRHFDGDEEWERLENAFDAPSASTPHLTMENTCITQGYWITQIGNAGYWHRIEPWSITRLFYIRNNY
jgi:hypothetical protein